jgi:ATP-dependent helicase YprA (DUF1998 family)
MAPTITQSIGELHSALCDYIEATYHISNPDLVDQRKELLNSIGVIHQKAYLESTPKYVSGDAFSTIKDLHPSVLQLLNSLSSDYNGSPKLFYNPPYKHQLEALDGTLVQEKNLMIMTGTGSGKTESFLMPILGKLAKEAHTGVSFQSSAVRALVLYPMNALVNDQLGRIRNIFGDARLKTLFQDWGGRIPTFARYTSRTPYPGIREKKKDQRNLKSFEEFYVEIEQATFSDDPVIKQKASKLLSELKRKGKWPAKPNVSKWYGSHKSHWQDSTGKFLRAVTLPNDSELITRQEIQANPPDVLITNYSMLEYMLMRPIERTIFEKTAKWLNDNPSEKFFIVIDEAHLYRGAAGAEVGLLLRRLRTRLNIPKNRFQVVCATASFYNKKYALEFASQLSGVEAETFIPIEGTLSLKEDEEKGNQKDVDILSSIDLEIFYNANGNDRFKNLLPFLEYRNVTPDGDSVEEVLYKALSKYGPLNKLVNLTMGQARPIDLLGSDIFTSSDSTLSDKAITTLLALGSIARQSKDDSGLLPCRVHTFFRGLPGLWACVDPNCKSLPVSETPRVCGKLYSQPRTQCSCGARVFELYTCRNCGTAHFRTYTDNIANPSSLWNEPGQSIRLFSSEIKDLFPLDLLMETPTHEEKTEPAYLDLITGRLNAEDLGESYRKIYIRRDRHIIQGSDDDSEESDDTEETIGMFVNCSVCGKGGGSRESAVQDHQTKGDQPFLSLLSKQIQIQPPNSTEATRFAPLRGRKVLIFSDSRQVAAKLAPNLQMYSLRDSVRPLLIWGFSKLDENKYISEDLCLDDTYLAVLIAANYFGVRLRPELSSGDTFFTTDQKIKNEIANGVLNDEMKFYQFFVKYRGEKLPEALLKEIVNAVSDKFTGLEALAIASIVPKKEFTENIIALPDIPTVATTPESKLALAQFWVRCWQKNNGYWFREMPPTWWKPAEDKSKGGVRGHKGIFRAMDRLLGSPSAKKIFKEYWLPELKNLTDDFSGLLRISGKHLTLDFDNHWVRCKNCSAVQRQIPNYDKCLECGKEKIEPLDIANDTVFKARKGYYRTPVEGLLSSSPVIPISLIAAEHTAQLNAPQNEDVFSKAEENELLFQDIDLEWPLGQKNICAIDILSSTTTMEVGIDIGALSGVALRNMPPGRANYQQRAGRAGRRGNAVATVLSFGSVDSHDEHYFSHPQEMISGPVVDPIITLDNIDIVKRHVRAFLLQQYHQFKLPEFLPSHHKANLFSVLGSVRDFIFDKNSLNRNDFLEWLNSNKTSLHQQILTWIPEELSEESKNDVIENFIQDCITSVDDAIDFELLKNEIPSDDSEPSASDEEPEATEEIDLGKLNLNDGLLDRLLYRGKLPRYAFPTDVATFHVFDQFKSTSFKTVMRFVPSQGLPIALTQYAPGRQVWISNKCYTSGAIYSPIRGELSEAWKKRKLYYECLNCGFAKTDIYNAEKKREKANCDACGNELEQPFNWMRPPGFAHPVDIQEETSPDGMPDVSYATRAKLYMPFPEADKWSKINERVQGLEVRTHLLVSNTGPEREAYHYCVRCGRIESAATFTGNLGSGHAKPYPDENPMCEGNATSKIVLGTDFITDVCLFSINLSPSIRLLPGNYTTDVALRTLCEALSKAAAQILEIEPNDILAEYRPALTNSEKGRTGEQVEIFLYDTLPGGAGFSTQLINKGQQLFEKALDVMSSCKEDCDSSCYRCLRIFKNKFEHRMLDRHVGIDLVKFILSGQVPALNSDRVNRAVQNLTEDLLRNRGDEYSYQLNTKDGTDKLYGIINVTKSDGKEFIFAISNPLTPYIPINQTAFDLLKNKDEVSVISIDEYLIRTNLPSATQLVLSKLRE